jgi:hypothetical protein
LYVFPHPAKVNAPVGSEIISGKKRYFYSGYDMPHLARVTFTKYVSNGLMIPVSYETITVEDANVFIDYAKKTIPRTIDYTTGLINYFFRGRLSAEPNCVSPDCNQIELYITNDSNNSGVPQTLKGGSFELYWDDEEGTRSEITDFAIPGWNSGSTLDYGQSTTGQFTMPIPGSGHHITEYILVYRGQINANPADPDPNDPNAIAVDTFGPPTVKLHITNITPEMGCPGSVLLIEGAGFSATPAENTVSFEDVNGIEPDVYATVLEADSNGTWLTAELPYFDAEDDDYYWVYAKVAVDGNVSDSYDFKLTNYIWCLIYLWDAGESVDDEFYLYVNDEYIVTSYLDPPESPTIVEIGFWYADDYHYVDTYLYDSYDIPGGTLEIIIEPYVSRVIAHRWNSSMGWQEYLYDNVYSGTFADYFGSDLLDVPDDGIELDVYLSLTYTGAMGLTETTSITIPEKGDSGDSGRISERHGQFDPGRVIEGNRSSDILIRKRVGKSANTVERGQARIRQRVP